MDKIVESHSPYLGGVNHLRYILLPGKCRPSFNRTDLYNKTYLYWKEFWTEVLRSLHSVQSMTGDDFLRQDVIGVVVSGEEIVGMHLYNFFCFDYEAHRDHSYLKTNYPEPFFESLQEFNAQYVMSMEYLTVSPSWRKSITGYSMANVLVGLGLNVLKDKGADAFIAVARNDLKISQLGFEFGARSVIANIIKHNVSCDLLTGLSNEVRPAKDEKVRSIVNQLWESRQDLSAFSPSSQRSGKKSA